MNAQEIKASLTNYIQKEFLYDKPELSLDDDTLLIEEEIIDSLGIFVLISFLAEELQVKIKPEEVVVENFETIGTITELVRSKLKN